MKNFRTFNLAVEFYRLMTSVKLPVAAKEQCHRASLSIALNLAEGQGKPTKKRSGKIFLNCLWISERMSGNPNPPRLGEYALLD